MDYGFAEAQRITNKNLAREGWMALKRAHTLKHYININGRDVEVPAPNYLSTPKLVGDAINPLHIK